MNEKYDHKNLPLDKGIARVLILELFSGKGYNKKAEIEAEILDHHLSNHGKEPEIKLGTAITRILSELEKEGKAEKHGVSKGLWRILSNTDDQAEGVPAQEVEMDVFEELKARDERIERLERVLLLVLSSEIGHRISRTADEYLGSFQTFPLKMVEMLVEEYGSVEKVIEKFPTIVEEKQRLELQR